MKTLAVLPALIVLAVSPPLMADEIPTCGACVDTQIFHDVLDHDAAWHELELRAGQRLVIETTRQRGAAALEVYTLEGAVQTTCATFGDHQVCGVVAEEPGVLGLLVDSSDATS